MPELPEVETVVRDLRGPLVGRRFGKVICGPLALRSGTIQGVLKFCRGKLVGSVERRGKWIIIDLHGPTLVIHLGMTGQLTVASAKIAAARSYACYLDPGPWRAGTSLSRHTPFWRCLLVRIPANCWRSTSRNPVWARNLWTSMPSIGANCLAETSRNLKAILLDQRVLAGVGNIYADEALFEARLAPTLLGKQLSGRQAEKLRRAIATVLRRGIAMRGSSIQATT